MSQGFREGVQAIVGYESHVGVKRRVDTEGSLHKVGRGVEEPRVRSSDNEGLGFCERNVVGLRHFRKVVRARKV